MGGPSSQQAGQDSFSGEQSTDRSLARAEKLASWLDDAYLDPLFGFIFPGGGDLAGAGLGLYLVLIAVRQKLPKVVIARMLLNLALDTAIGSVPLLGDLFDIFFKAHKRNAVLLRGRAASGRARPGDWAWVFGALLLFLAALVAPLVVLILLVMAIT